MCIGLPLQVTAVEPGHALCADAGGPRRVRTSLVGDVQPGDWLLVFLGDAQERISPQRAVEVRATLALLAEAMGGTAPAAPADAGFDLPSRWTTEQLRALSGAAPAPVSVPEPVPVPESAA